MAIIPAQISPAELFRIVSLLPAATEIVAALGLGSHLIGRSHECDEPPSVTALPALTQARFSSNASSLDIHQAVGAALKSPRLIGQSALYSLDIAQLASLQPDLILTQAVCAVCAISADDVAAAVKQSGHAACVLALSPTTRGALPSWEHIVNDARIITRENIALCCRSCNSSKGQRSLADWIASPYCKRRGISPETVAEIVKAALSRNSN